MSSIWGHSIRISVFGESHGAGIGVVVDGFPSGVPIDLDRLAALMERRAPGRTPWSTARKEADRPEILSGLYQGCTTGTPITALIRNTDTRSVDYAPQASCPRPGHADYTGSVRYGGFQDPRGGGHFSGRLTAPLVFAGGLCLQWLALRGIRVYAHAARIGGIDDSPLDLVRPDEAALAAVADKRMPVLSDEAGKAMATAVEQARQDTDSVGGVVEGVVLGLPAGLGDPMFLGLEARLGSLLFSIPAVKAVGFGDGFGVSDALGSTNNDRLFYDDGTVRMRTNHGGGIDGGISNGMPVVFRAAFKPTPSIASPQETVDLAKREETLLVVKGRHDPCIVPRAVPVVEACAALVIADTLKGAPHHDR
ncbi:MAG: chorismate synthase [Clostridiaceae bacterium]|nr:chorismate synthase [Clostridiaceae bacterium]